MKRLWRDAMDAPFDKVLLFIGFALMARYLLTGDGAHGYLALLMFLPLVATLALIRIADNCGRHRIAVIDARTEGVQR